MQENVTTLTTYGIIAFLSLVLIILFIMRDVGETALKMSTFRGRVEKVCRVLEKYSFYDESQFRQLSYIVIPPIGPSQCDVFLSNLKHDFSTEEKQIIQEYLCSTRRTAFVLRRAIVGGFVIMLVGAFFALIDVLTPLQMFK